MKQALLKYIRAADYIAAAQIYLRGNFLLTEPLKREHIKPRLLGHWGTCPGINFTYAHLNRAIIEHDLEMMFVLGPGHGFPAVQANLFLEGTLGDFYPSIGRDGAGLSDVIKRFSWPYGFPSHSNPEAPGVILEGGELGYSLATSYGTILDNPNLIVACMVGDGEAETGPIATAWHLSKLIDPGKNGAVLPILHVNGYKISGPTFYGRMSDEELTELFRGYGYDPLFVDAYADADVHDSMMAKLDQAIKDIRFTQHCAREGTLTKNPRWPMIILRTPKGWHSIDYIDDKKIEDNHYSHQVIADGALHDDEEFRLLEEWLRSYNFTELFDGANFLDEINSLMPAPHRRMGSSLHAHGGEPHYKPLKLPALSEYAVANTCDLNDPICGQESSMEKIGMYLRDVMKLNESERNIRLFSPDETYSNKLQAVFEVTDRAFVWPHKEWDRNLAWDGRVLEMLSEHSLQGLIQGYVLTGRHGVFASYEAFIQVVASMADQYAKFIKVAREVSWRKTIPSLNYILTSGAWRQEHNGFSHQNPGFIDDMLQRQGCFTNVYFPADANIALATFDRMMQSTREINVLVCSKRPIPVWRTTEEAATDVRDGLAIWDFASDENPDLVYVGVGDYPTQEVLAAMSIVRQEMPKLKMRFVNIVALSALGMGSSSCRILPQSFEEYFTENKPIIVNFHGYPQTMKQILFDYGCESSRVSVRGYVEAGSTTTVFDMMVRNKVDRFHLAMEAFDLAVKAGVATKKQVVALKAKYEAQLVTHRAYVIEHGDDPADITNWSWQSR